MALIKCSECGKEMSDKAKICPHCGFEKKECPECGKEVKSKNNVCENCGFILKNDKKNIKELITTKIDQLSKTQKYIVGIVLFVIVIFVIFIKLLSGGLSGVYQYTYTYRGKLETETFVLHKDKTCEYYSTRDNDVSCTYRKIKDKIYFKSEKSPREPYMTISGKNLVSPDGQVFVKLK